MCRPLRQSASWMMRAQLRCSGRVHACTRCPDHLYSYSDRPAAPEAPTDCSLQRERTSAALPQHLLSHALCDCGGMHADAELPAKAPLVDRRAKYDAMKARQAARVAEMEAVAAARKAPRIEDEVYAEAKHRSSVRTTPCRLLAFHTACWSFCMLPLLSDAVACCLEIRLALCSTVRRSTPPNSECCPAAECCCVFSL